MKTPLNAHAMEVFRRLADVIEKTNDADALVKIWADGDYVSIELQSLRLPINEVRLALSASPLEADEVAALEQRLADMRSAK